MARSSDLEEREIWGTWEELLLACAVNRHGTRRWDAVAIEIQSRTPASHLITPHGCRQRYRDLQRRFRAGAVDGSSNDGGGEDDPHPPADVLWVEELRRLRVAELRREVERYDLSIGSLRLKVKRLKDERERSVRDAESGDGKPVVDAKKEVGAPGSAPESLSGNRIFSGGNSGPSCKQSNSTDPKHKAGEDCREPEEEAAFAGAGSDAAEPSTAGDEKAAEGSYDSSTGSPAARTQAMGESIAESKGVEGGEKESSDVQSSVSLSRRRGKAIFGGGGVEEPEAEEASIMSGVGTAVSQPLVSILEIIRSHKYGSVFERRLDSQESARYRSIVRQHVDLEIVQAKLDRVGPERSYATPEFFRDLLLLCGNATVFYPKDSPESAAAVHLRRLVTKKMATTTFLTPTEPTPLPPHPPPEPKPTASKSETEPDLSSGLIDKANSSPLLITCRKRSSTSNKPAVAAVEEKKEEKSDPARKESDNEEKSLPKKATKERSVRPGRTRGWRTSKVRGGNGEGGPAAKRSNLAPSPCLKSKPVENVAAVGEAARPYKKNTGGGAATCAASAAKKQGSTGFLKRVKRNPKGADEEVPKSSSGGVSGGGGGSGRGTEQKKEAKGGARKEQGSRQGSTGGGGSGGSGKKVAETSGGTAKRGVGRPPKRAREEADIAAPTKAPASASRKRGRM
ncbi:hypothetical protein OPV22_012853 [Ensete ventricosum]|uniref:Bromo domain-containing protein n=1 Tax=Ensete ventricosum TaxID=4639 RepID=A0AAV8R418_ENSVE|nr:hypothetical protein OPV22_012853 [Ensete ventricosum]